MGPQPGTKVLTRNGTSSGLAQIGFCGEEMASQVKGNATFQDDINTLIIHIYICVCLLKKTNIYANQITNKN